MVCTISSVPKLWFSVGVFFIGDIALGAGGSLTLLHALKTHFLLLACLAPHQNEDFCLVKMCLVFFSCLAAFSSRPVLLTSSR